MTYLLFAFLAFVAVFAYKKHKRRTPMDMSSESEYKPPDLQPPNQDASIEE